MSVCIIREVFKIYEGIRSVKLSPYISTNFNPIKVVEAKFQTDKLIVSMKILKFYCYGTTLTEEIRESRDGKMQISRKKFSRI